LVTPSGVIDNMTELHFFFVYLNILQVWRRFYHPKSTINSCTYMQIRQKKSSGTTHQATEMMTWRTLA